jgi:hypothetical protein
VPLFSRQTLPGTRFSMVGQREAFHGLGVQNNAEFSSQQVRSHFSIFIDEYINISTIVIVTLFYPFLISSLVFFLSFFPFFTVGIQTLPPIVTPDFCLRTQLTLNLSFYGFPRATILLSHF